MQKKNKRTQYSFYAYNCPGCGEYYHNGHTYTFGEDYRNVKRYKEYLDCGFDIVQARGGGEKGNHYHGEAWETSNCKNVFTKFLKAGGKKVLVSDELFDAFINVDKDLIGEGKRFASEEALDKAVKERVSAYCHEKGFYGIQLLDEPQYVDFPAYGQLVRSLKRVLPDAELQCNLLPLAAGEGRLTPQGDDLSYSNDPTIKFAQETCRLPHEKKQAIYIKYLKDVIAATGLNNILFDEYPFIRGYIIRATTLPNYQIVARICQEQGLDFRTVLQSYSHVTEGIERNRRINESDMYWQTNLAMGFGAREFSFYTYFAKPDFDYQKGMGEVDGAAFINLDGSRTALYEYTKRIIAEMKKFSRVALKYSYQSSHIVTEKEKTHQDFSWTETIYEALPCPIDVQVGRGVACVTRQTNADDELYMIENIGNVKEELFDGIPPMQVCVELPKGKKNFYFRGKKIRVKANKDGKYTMPLKVGDAVFVEILK